MTGQPLRVLVLTGGPDREREVCFQSADQVAAALQQAGHTVRVRDITPDHIAPLEEAKAWPCDVVFPALHGRWGEGGTLQILLEQRGLRFVGCRADAAALCIDKARAKELMRAHGLPTPASQLVAEGQPLDVPPPLVLKAPDEDSSFGLEICPDHDAADAARRRMHPTFGPLLAEAFVGGRELTVGVLDGPDGTVCLPPIHIVPAGGFYDFQAKYERDDTQYLFDTGLTDEAVAHLGELARRVFTAAGCRHLARVDMIVDHSDRPWLIEVNTMPGFTAHSLLPMAAARAGIPMAALTDRLVRQALRD